jgi:hypothetical protein
MFSAGPSNASGGGADEDDPYGFDVDFSSKRLKKQPSKSSRSSKPAESDSDSDEDPAAQFQKRRERSGGRGSNKKKESSKKQQGSALDRASVYLNKYKNADKDKDTKREVEPDPIGSPDIDAMDFDAFMNDESGEQSPPVRSGRARRKSLERTSPIPRDNISRNIDVDDLEKLLPNKGSASPKLR